MVTFLVGLVAGLVGGGAVVYLYYAKIVADLNKVITAANTVKTDVKAL